MALTLLSALLACIPAADGQALPGSDIAQSTLPRLPARECLPLMQASLSGCFESEHVDPRSFSGPLAPCQDSQTSCAAHNHPVRTPFVFGLLVLTDLCGERNSAVLRTRRAIKTATSLRKAFAVSFPAPPAYSAHAPRIRSTVLLGRVADVAQSAFTVAETCV